MDVEPPVTRARSTATATTPTSASGLAAAREERESRGRHYAEADIAAPHPGDTPVKATGRRAAAEVRRTLSGRPSRTYLIVALLTGALGLMASVWPRMAARIMLPSNSAAFGLPEHSLAAAAVNAVIEKSTWGGGSKVATSTSPTRARAWPSISLPFLSARASTLAAPNDTLFRLLGATWLAAAAASWALRNAAFSGKLGFSTYRRLLLGLTASAAAEALLLPRLFFNLSWTGLWIMLLCGFAKVAGPMRMMPGEGFKRNLSLARRGIVAKPTDLISLAWSTLAPTLLATGLSYVLLPSPTARLVLGAAPSRGPTLALWQLAGASIATLLVPMALNLKVAEDHDRLAAPTHAMESLALAAAAGVHVAAFARDLEHGRGSLLGTPAAIGLWSLVGLAAAAGLPVLHAGEVTPQMRREE